MGANLKNNVTALAVIFLSLIALSVQAQKQGNIWYFGDSAGVDFNSGTPVAVHGGTTYISSGRSHNEGCTVLCDSAGGLLLYSDGEQVWNKHHQVMPNGGGLLGGFSSSQAALAIPQPNSSRYMYLFTTDDFIGSELTNGLRYNVIDMCLNEGLGDILPSQKNILAVDTVSEKLVAARHANGTDYWVVTHKFYSDEFWALHLTENGITDTVVSAIGSRHDGVVYHALGQMKISPDGSKLAIAAGNGFNILELFDFDNATGMLSNFKPLVVPDTSQVYGVEFSPNNNVLYAWNSHLTNGLVYSQVTQYNLTANNISASRQNIFYVPHAYISESLQLGPDNKIYTSASSQNYLAVIDSPNLLGAACHVRDSAIYLLGKSISYSLPSFIAGYSYSNKLADCNVGIDDVDANTSVSVFPNPSNSNTLFQFKQFAGEKYQLAIYNSIGQAIYSINGIMDGMVTVQQNTLPKGLYLYQVRNEKGAIANGKLIIE